MAKNDSLLPLLLIGGAAFFLTRRTAAASNGADPYYDPDPDPLSEAGSGPALVNGSISSVGAEASMGFASHRLTRDTGDVVNLSATWTNNTKDFKGNPIPWDFKLEFKLGHSTGVLGIAGWDTMTELLGSGGVKDVIRKAPSGTNTTTAQVVMAKEPNPPKNWDLDVILYAKQSDAQGNPTGQWIPMGKLRHDNAVQSIKPIPTSGKAVVAGDVTGVGATAGHTLYEDVGMVNSPSARLRGSNMRRLSMRQQRPPWGMIGHPDVRQWPRSDRNPMLPGVKIMVRQRASPIGPGRRMYAV
tara:strand:- start:2298 stop:3194 length:897 start_codon:yes stop_codon:yes gene_type:complete